MVSLKFWSINQYMANFNYPCFYTNPLKFFMLFEIQIFDVPNQNWHRVYWSFILKYFKLSNNLKVTTISFHNPALSSFSFNMFSQCSKMKSTNFNTHKTNKFSPSQSLLLICHYQTMTQSNRFGWISQIILLQTNSHSHLNFQKHNFTFWFMTTNNPHFFFIPLPFHSRTQGYTILK